MDIVRILAEEQKIRTTQVEAVIKLIDEGNTIPFIARYRKEAHGGLNDEILRNLDERLRYLRGLEERKEAVLASIEEQGKLTDELKKEIEAAMTLVAVEDLYRPYKQKRRTRAIIAKERGLEPLANLILLQMTKKDLLTEAAPYVDPEKEVPTPEDAIAGAKDIIAENISDNAEYRTYIRDLTMKQGTVVCESRVGEESSVYENYYKYERPVAKQPGHATLAINRGEEEKILSVKILTDTERAIGYLVKKVVVRDNPNTTPALKEAIEDAYERLIWPSIEREVRNELTEVAEDGAIKVFGKNLRQLLMQPPISGHVVLGWDPAFRTGCKLAVVDATGKVLDTVVIYPTAPQNKVN
ncbi:MAG: RNA-binding transcriptional accessory protein, partial [Lachnospiraceae bacterium]|nr:RNA-binding transcriptional accessory protein [Lachnospiraceae bacterium]